MLIGYAQSLSEFLSDKLDFEIENDEVVPLNQMANIHSIELSR